MIAKRLKNIRQAKGMTRQEAASGSGISEYTIFNHETGKRVPGMLTLADYCTFYGVTPNWMFGVEDKDAVEALTKLRDRLNDEVEKLSAKGDYLRALGVARAIKVLDEVQSGI